MGSGAERGRRGERNENNIERHRNRKIVKGIKRYSKERNTLILDYKYRQVNNYWHP
jgi:hypothetical protein